MRLLVPSDWFSPLEWPQITLATFLGNTLNAKILAFTFRLAAEVERAMISQRTKEALARKWSEGKRLGWPKGSRSKTTKLTGKEAIITELVAKQVSMSAIARILGVHRKTIAHYLQQQERFSRKSLRGETETYRSPYPSKRQTVGFCSNAPASPYVAVHCINVGFTPKIVASLYSTCPTGSVDNFICATFDLSICTT